MLILGSEDECSKSKLAFLVSWETDSDNCKQEFYMQKIDLPGKPDRLVEIYLSAYVWI